MLVDVVLPTWDRWDLLEPCLQSLRAQDLPHQVFVVDNGSRDGTPELVTRHFPDVRLVALPANLGFGRAVNLGVEAGQGDVVVVLNNDTVAPPEFLRRLVAPLAADPSLESSAGVLVDADGTIDAAGVVVDRTLAGYSHLHGQPLSALPGAAAPLGPCGGAAAHRRSALSELGGYDPEIFAYGEDVDLALRARERGHRCVVAGDARVLHRGGATLGQRSLRQLRVAGWSRGYLLGRYRLPLWAVLVESGVAVVDAARTRSTVPLRSRWSGWRRGRALPARRADRQLMTLTTLAGLGRRARA